MALTADAVTPLIFDASCSTDPDLSPQIYGPAQQGLGPFSFPVLQDLRVAASSQHF